MTREMTFGLLLVAVLTGVFGFMVYKRMHTPADLSANADDVAGADPTDGALPEDVGADRSASTMSAQDPLPMETVTQASGIIAAPVRLPAPATKSAPSWPPADDDPFVSEAQSASAKPAAPANAGASNDPFAGEAPEALPVHTTPSNVASTAPPMDDPFVEPGRVPALTPSPQPFNPFSAPEAETTAAPRATGTSSATTRIEPADDPFANEQTPNVPETTTTARSTPVPLPQDSFDPLAANQVAPAESAPETDPLALPVPQKGESEFTGATPRAAVRVLESDAAAASSTIIERPVGRAAPAPSAAMVRMPGLSFNPAASVPAAASGSTYVLQPQDNFWTISKKIYGAGRYAEALARHNAATVPDPQRMQPGMPIATPSADELESLYPELIPDLQTAAATTTIVATGATYVTVPGDNFWTISRKVYGHGRYFQALAEHNHGTIADPLKLQPGTTLLTPPVEVLQAREMASSSAAPLVSARVTEEGDPAVEGFFLSADDQPQYRVMPGDTLTSIARAHLGRASRSIQILEMNRDVLKGGNTVSVGTVLRLPADASHVQPAP